MEKPPLKSKDTAIRRVGGRLCRATCFPVVSEVASRRLPPTLAPHSTQRTNLYYNPRENILKKFTRGLAKQIRRDYILLMPHFKGGVMMQSDLMPKEMLKLWKNSWEAYFKAMDAVSDQGEKMLELMLKQGDEVKEETKKMMKEWTSNAKDLQNKYKQSVEEAVKKFDEIL